MTSDIRLYAAELLKKGQEVKAVETHQDMLGLSTVNGPKTKKWLNDVLVFSFKLPDKYPLKNEIEQTYKRRNNPSTFEHMMSFLESIISDDDLDNDMSVKTLMGEPKARKKYDVFISHASKDKLNYVEDLYFTLRRLGVNIFYDSDIISWGDNWKEIILDGTSVSEFAIIVISDSFFGREWTERELNEFLKRQNESGQKIVLPLLHNITRDQLKKHYPELEEIHVVDTASRSKEDIAILFAKELIKRYR